MTTNIGFGKCFRSIALLAVLGPISQAACAWSLWDMVDPDTDFGAKVAGTFLRIGESSAQILQVGADGNIALTLSDQYGGGLLNAPYGDTLGSWSRTGRTEITAPTVNITYSGDTGELLGVGAFTYVISFDDKFQNAAVDCEGAIYGPGVDPSDPGAEPLPDTEFACSTLEFHRLSATAK